MPEERVRLIVGLGNPGQKYRHTRHNMGFMVADRLAQAHGLSLDKCKFDVIYGRGTILDVPVLVAKPVTFMNRVGPAVQKLARFFRLETQDITVIHDDLDLVFGTLKIKEKGGDGGHNGVKSLITALGTQAFTRVRVGIGRPEEPEQITGYVLSRFDAEQEGWIEDLIAQAQDAVETVLTKGVKEAMNRFHGRNIS
jgi:PTH1 family peptidyl-tRNA hydrolase